VQIWTDTEPLSWRIWKLIPVKTEVVSKPSGPSSETLNDSSSPPLYEGAGGQPSTQTQRTESEDDDFGTVVTEVTIVTTRKKYRVQEVRGVFVVLSA